MRFQQYVRASITSVLLACSFNEASLEEITADEEVLSRSYCTLAVNNAKGIGNICIKSQEDGEQDLYHLATTSEFEGAWAYIPSENKWIDVGKNSRTYFYGEESLEGESSVYMDHDILEKIREAYDEVVLYHIHPTSFLHQFLILINQRNKKEYETQKRVGEVNLATPSTEDIISMKVFSIYFYQQHAGSHTSYRIVSEHGIAQLQLTRNGLERYSSFDDEILSVVLSIENMETDIQRRLNPLPADPDSYCRQLSDENMSLSFHPKGD